MPFAGTKKIKKVGPVFVSTAHGRTETTFFSHETPEIHSLDSCVGLPPSACGVGRYRHDHDDRTNRGGVAAPGGRRWGGGSWPGSDLILIPPGTYLIDETLSIRAGASGAFILRGLGAKASDTVIDAQDLHAVFRINQSNSVTIENLTITGGHAMDGMLITFQGGGSTPSNPGGGIFNQGQLKLVDVIVDGNRAGDTHSVNAYNFGVGGGIFNGGHLTIENSTISNNRSGNGDSGGGVAPCGAGIWNEGDLFMRNCTFSGNATGNSNNGGLGGGIANIANAVLENLTIAGNSSDRDGGGIWNHTDGSLTLINSIVAGNSAGTGDDNMRNDGTLDEHGVNLLSGDPKLGPLFENGGPTLTRIPYANSPAVDAGVAYVNPAPEFSETNADQRGFLRVQDGNEPADGNAVIDIGAVERGNIVAPPLFEVRDSRGNLITEGSVNDIGSIRPLESIDQVFTIQNNRTVTLTGLSALISIGDSDIVPTFDSTTLAPGESTSVRWMQTGAFDEADLTFYEDGDGEAFFQAGLFSVLEANPPVNDDWSDAISLNGIPATNGTRFLEGSLFAATTEPDEPATQPAGGRTAWWRWEAAEDGTVWFENSESWVIEVFESADQLSDITAMEDRFQPAAGSAFDPVVVHVEAGKTYDFRWVSWEGVTSGPFGIPVHFEDGRGQSLLTGNDIEVIDTGGAYTLLEDGTNFGAVAPGRAQTNVFSISNDGDGVLMIDIEGISVTGNSAFSVEVPTSSGKFAPGAQFDFGVRF